MLEQPTIIEDRMTDFNKIFIRTGGWVDSDSLSEQRTIKADGADDIFVRISRRQFVRGDDN